LADGELAINLTDEKLYFKNAAGAVKLLASTAGSTGDVVGPASATNNALAAFDGTTGKLIKNASLTANNVLLGNGTGAPLVVAPGTAGNVLSSNGTTWTSAALPAGGLTYVVKTANYTTKDKEGVLADTSGGAFTVTLPATPATGAQVVIADSGNAWGTNNLTVGRNGSTIGGLAENLICDITGASVQFVYDGTTWEVYAQIGGQGGNVATLDGTQTLTNKTLTDPKITLGGTNGTTGQALLSQGTGLAPVWGNVDSVVQYPQNSRSADYTLVLGDAGKQIFHPASDASRRTFTIPANSSVAFPVGTVVLFTVENGGRFVNVAITSDTLVLGGGTTGTTTVPPNNTLMCIKVTATKWMANFLFQTTPAFQAIAVAHNTSPNISAYPWSGSGFGTKYADPATLPTGQGNGVAFSPAGDAIAVAHFTSLFVSAYPWSGSGFGTKYADPATIPTSTGNGVAFSPTGDAIAVAHNSSPFVSAYPWSGSGFGTKYADPATLPTGDGRGVAFSPTGDAIAVAHSTSPFVSAYPWSGSGFGTKFANPATLPASTSIGVAFSPAGDAVAVAHGGSPRISAYPWSGSGFGTKYADPATIPPSTANGVAFSPAGDAIAVAHDVSPFVSAYPWSGSGFGTKYANPATLPTGTGWGVAFSPAGDAIAVAHDSSPFVSAYPWSGSGFGTKFANPVTLPTGNAAGVAFTFNP
jgi:hypothetical protein